MPAQSNATLTRVATPGVPDDWDVAASAGADKWTGTARAYYRESRDRVVQGDSVTFVSRRELILDNDLVVSVGIAEDDVLTFTTDLDGVTSTATASSIPRRELAGIPKSVQTSRIVLEDV